MKKVIDEEEIRATVEALPTDLSDETIKTVMKRRLLPKNIMLYRAAYREAGEDGREKKQKIVRGWCSACHEESDFEYVKNDAWCRGAYSGAPFGFIEPISGAAVRHKGACVCPNCGAGVEAHHIAGPKVVAIDEHLAVTVHNVRGHLAVLSWSLEKNVNKDTLKYGVDVRLWEGVFVVGGVLFRVVGYMRNLGGTVMFFRNWELRKKHESGLFAFEKSEILPFSKKLVDMTDSANCSLYEYVAAGEGGKIYPGEYLLTWCKWPQVENLARQGYGKYLSGVIDCETTYEGWYYAREHFYISNVKNHIDMKQTKPHRMIRLEKSEAWIAKEFGYDVTEYYKKMKERRGVKLDREALTYLKVHGTRQPFDFWLDENNGTGSWAEAYRKMFALPPVRTLHYLDCQNADVAVYRDYLVSLCDVIGADEFKKLKTDDMFPKDLQTAHDRTVARRRAKEDAELKAKFKAQLKERAFMAWSDAETGLMIRAAASQKELIEEGQKLHHCVAGYAGAHAEGKLTIFFIRHIETPDVPFFTLEYKNGKVCQNRGNHNCARTPEVVIFEKKWLEYLQTLNKKETKNGRKQNAASRVGA